MSFLAPWSAVLAAAIAVPVLLLLYFLRLRRRQLRIASTMLWQKSYEDLQVNVPFQRIRWSVLLILQLLLLLLLLLALAEPMIRGDLPLASRIVLLIDCSASMNAVLEPSSNEKPARTRLDAAKGAAREMIDQLGRSNQASQIMLIAFASRPQVVSGFESDGDALRDAVDSIQPTDEQDDLDAALQLAAAFAASSDESADLADAPPAVVLLSDGVLTPPHDATGYRLRAGEFRFMQVVPSSSQAVDDGAGSDGDVSNIGFASFSVRRDYDDPGRVLVFARLVNAGAGVHDVTATLMIDGQAAASIRRSVPPASESGPGEATIAHALDLAGGAVLSIRHGMHDDLTADDAAATVLPPPKRPRVALVHPNGSRPDAWLHDLLQALEPQRIDPLSVDAYAARNASEPGAALNDAYDLIVFDRGSGMALPDVPSLTIGGVPAGIKTIEPLDSDRESGRAILSWDRQHPVMRQVALDTILYSDFGSLELPAGATPLAFGPDGPIMAALRTRGVRHIVVGFALGQSNWPVHVSSTVFMQNAFDYLVSGSSGQMGLTHKPGESASVRAGADARELVIDGPSKATIAVEPGATVNLPPIPRVGLYTVRGAAAPHEQIAVSLLSDVESDIRPRDAVTVNAESLRSNLAARSASRPLWPWLLAAALVLLILEWLTYLRRIHG